MKKRIGILGGISHESTIEYYKLIHEIYYQQYRNYNYPEIVIYSLDFQKFTDYEDTGDKIGYREYIMLGIRALEKAGVDFVIMAANSPHAVFKEVQNQTNLLMLSIAEVTAKHAKNEDMRVLLLLGIKFTMQSSFYHEVCKNHRIKVIVPTDEEQNEINKIIFEELVIGVFKKDSKDRLLSIMDQYRVDGVILGCTELPLLLKQDDTNVKLLNTMELHVKAALKYALSSN